MSKANLPDQIPLDTITRDIKLRAMKERGAGNLAAAVDLVRRGQLLQPDDGLLKNFEALALLEQDDRAAARTSIDRALKLGPTDAGVWRYLGSLDFVALNPTNARRAWRRSLLLSPASQATLRNLMQVERQAGLWPAAERAGRWSLIVDPENHAAAFELGKFYLSLGHWAKGWLLYDRRIHIGEVKPRQDRSDLPFWDGKPARNLRLLVRAEENIGDQIQFAQLLPELLERVGHVTMECDPRLVPVFRRSFPTMDAVPRVSPPQGTDRFDAQLPQGHLARLFRSDISNFARTPGRWLAADQNQVDTLRRRYRGWSGGDPVIGIAWKSRNSAFRGKNVPLDDWVPILRVPGVRFLSLQYGDVADDLTVMRGLSGTHILHDPEIDALHDLDRFGAQLDAVDLVISISNSTVHQACALGRDVWTLLHVRPDWRWGLEDDTSPWFPTLRLYRQSARFAWGPVATAIAGDLTHWRSSHRLAADGTA